MCKFVAIFLVHFKEPFHFKHRLSISLFAYLQIELYIDKLFKYVISNYVLYLVDV